LKKVKAIFVNHRGEIRLSWLAAAALVMYGIAAAGVYELYWYLYRTMMRIWCVTGENIMRAPGAVQFLYSWSNVIVQLLQNALLFGFAACFSKIAGLRRDEKSLSRGGVKGALLGALCVAAMWCVLMLTGSIRLGWRLSRPAFSVSTFALTITLISSAAAECAFFYGAVYGVLKKRLPAWAALGVMMAVNAIHMGVWLPAAFFNGMLLAAVCCILKEKHGLGAAVGFRFAWRWLEQAVFGFAGSAAGLYESYPVNLYWLCGGNAGIMNGAIASAALITVIYLLIRKDCPLRLPEWKKRSKSPS